MSTVNKYHPPVTRTPNAILLNNWKNSRQLRRQVLRGEEYELVKAAFKLPRRISREIARVIAQRRFRNGEYANELHRKAR
jgi:hypothetical protein